MDCLTINALGVDQAGVGFPGSSSSKMDDNAARADACREYQSSLEDLTFNSKPHINMLTILAEENINFAKDIVAIIEAQISKAPPTEKLPLLYLVDSIVKNVGGEYLAVFAKNLITSFICVFEKVDENTRKSLFKLRSTWDEVFPLKKLYALDVRVNSADTAWPIKPLPPTVNASIHVNPKFLKQSEEVPPPQPSSSPQPPAPATEPAPQSTSNTNQYNLTQEQLIRQQLLAKQNQLLAKQKQLLELQQKKIELELEQTKAQLAGGFTLPSSAPVPATPSMTSKPTTQAAPVVRPWIPPQTEPKSSTRDPRLNRPGPPTAPQPKEQSAERKADVVTTGNAAVTPEKCSQPDKTRTQKKEVLEEKSKSKSPPPMSKTISPKNKQSETEAQKSADPKKDPRLKKRSHDKMDNKDDEAKDKKRSAEKKERQEDTRGGEPQRSGKGRVMNGTVNKHEHSESTEKADLKSGGNARTHARKRPRSRSRSRSPGTSPKRKERRSPKSRVRSSSLSPSPSRKANKARRLRPEEMGHGKPGREDRLSVKKNQLEARRLKRPTEERHSETRDNHSPRSHDGGGKENKDAPHRWRSGWEENKHLKPSEDSHTKLGLPRHKQYSTPNRPPTSRTPKHRLNVDPNLQIPEILNAASKKDLLRRASKRLESGEISQEDFLNVAHKIKTFFQYQEEKQQQQHSGNWDDSGVFSKKQSLLPTPSSSEPHPLETMDAAELSYYEHKSKLKKTQVTHRPNVGEWEGEQNSGESKELAPSEKADDQNLGPSLHRYNRVPLDASDERRSKENEDQRVPPVPMIEEYNHGKEFPKLKSLPGLRFRRRADPRDSNEREWNSPLMERQRYDEDQKSGYDAPRKYGPSADSRVSDPRRPDQSSGPVVHRKCPSPGSLDSTGPRFERERLSPLQQREPSEMSPIPRFESPNSEHSDDGPLNLDGPPSHTHPPPPKSTHAGPSPGGQLASLRLHRDSPGHTPPYDGGHPTSLYDGPVHRGPSRANPPGWYEGGGPEHYDDVTQFEGPHPQGPSRLDGGRPLQRFDGHGPMRVGDGMGRFDCQPHPHGPNRFDGQGPGPARYERYNNMGPGPGSGQNQRPMRFETPLNQMGPMRFEGPGPRRFDGPMQAGPRFDMPHQGGAPVYDPVHSQQVPGRFPPQHNLQPPIRPIVPPMYENPMGPQQNLNMGQHFPEPVDPQFPVGQMAYSAQAPAFNQQGSASFYNPSAPGLSMQQPVNLLGSLNQSFPSQSAVPFGHQTPQIAPTENHFGQMDVNELLSKLISNGIIKAAQPEATLTSGTASGTAPAGSPLAEEDDEDDPELLDNDVPDLRSFTIEAMKLRYESVVTKLYSGTQCGLCSMRFSSRQPDLYGDHLDWHYRQNHNGKVPSKKVTHRRWYYGLRDWIEFEEIADLEERAKSLFFEKENEVEVQKNQAAAKEKEVQCVKATKDQVGESCEICQEQFETYWVEEEEDWFLKNAIRVDDKIFHPSCFEDYKNSYIDVTPSPNKLLTDHPLSSFIKTEDGVEETACSVSATVKQEVESELPDIKAEEVLTVTLQSEQSDV
ncbi:pre-mRNA cleavage complex 2 protein Pcf11 [Takifugu rubripes]|uniref:pre-mRNA cleavage complex 2 protein Pcf11 n=1 Tax=Takifugu rubripes TaxID=31033 RepID=UPI001145714A|nr:pre-mRNA cleavage complex 2 protein Pcf11 [Takifugu rubripes]